jgi:hypothetical protein
MANLEPSCASVDTVRRTVLQVNALCRTTTLRFTLAVGELVLKNLYSGDIRRLRSRKRKEHFALRRVAADPDLSMSPTTLYRSMAIFEVCERINVRAWKHVSTTHVRLVLALPAADQEQLLCDAEANRWGVRDLERRVAAVAEQGRPSPARGGRKRRARLRAVVDGMQREVDRLTTLFESGEEVLADLSPESVHETLGVLERLRDACARVAERIARAPKESAARSKDRRATGRGGE